MGHVMCRECHRLVSERARACPYCGVSRPVVTRDPDGVFAGPRGKFTLITLLLTLGIAWFRHQVHQLADSPKPLPVAPVESVQLGPVTKVCLPGEAGCVPVQAAICPEPWTPESGKVGASPPPPPREQEWCAAHAVGRASGKPPR
jgi:hypothetical protein